MAKKSQEPLSIEQLLALAEFKPGQYIYLGTVRMLVIGRYLGRIGHEIVTSETIQIKNLGQFDESFSQGTVQDFRPIGTDYGLWRTNSLSLTGSGIWSAKFPPTKR